MFSKFQMHFFFNNLCKLVHRILIFVNYFFTAAVLTPQQAAVAVINPFPPGPTK